MTRGAISKLADRLSAKALLTRVPGRQDRRYHDVALTAPVARWCRNCPRSRTVTMLNSSAS